ncbi:hypothetical protein MXB_3995 [Myxobolus squamalis]|nr:hypothetical protein MXB_3995 [Myxobolus squamalis]
MLIDTLHPKGLPKKESFRDIPLREIFGSPHLYLTSVAHLANNFILYMMLTNHPKYLKSEYGADLRQSSVIPIIAFACNTIAQIPFSIATQYAQKTIQRPETFFRKVNGVIGFFGASLFLLPIGFTGCSMFKSEIYIVLCMILLAANQCAFFVGMINLSRKYAAIVMGFSNSIASIAGFVTPVMVSAYQEAYGIHDGWTYSYITTAALTITGGAIWLIFGSCEPQYWGVSKTIAVTEKNNESIEVEAL